MLIAFFTRLMSSSTSALEVILSSAPRPAQATDAAGALAIGDTLAVASAIIDGVVRFTKSRNTPPPVRPISFEGVKT